MSPEQAQGGAVDHRTDIYSLGVMLYEMLTQTIPHNAPTALGILMKRTTQPPVSPRAINPAISRSLEGVVLRSLAIHPANRYDSAEDFIAALKIASADESYQEAGTGSLQRKTVPFDFPALATVAPQKGSFTAKLPAILRNPFWLTIGAIFIAAVALSLSSGSAFRSVASQTTPTLVAQAPPATHTPTATPSPTPSPTATNTPVPTQTPAPPASTLRPRLPTPTATDTPTLPTLPVVSPTPTPTPTKTATVSPIPKGDLNLLSPLSLELPSYGPTTFEWQWTGAELPAELGFEVRVWRDGEPPVGAHDAVRDNQQNRIEQIGADTYSLSINIQRAFGVRERTGRYLWTVALVQVSPNYADLDWQAEPAYLRFEAGGGGSKEDEGGGVVIQ
jgi:serine/threonine protein kinase